MFYLNNKSSSSSQASRQSTSRRQCLFWKDYAILGLFTLGGLSHHRVSFLQGAWMCLALCRSVCVHHRGKEAPRAAVPALPCGCLLTVPFTSQHGPGYGIWQKWLPCHISLRRHTNRSAPSKGISAHTYLTTCWYMWIFRACSKFEMKWHFGTHIQSNALKYTKEYWVF